jgi:hypothetical protein
LRDSYSTWYGGITTWTVAIEGQLPEGRVTPGVRGFRERGGLATYCRIKELRDIYQGGRDNYRVPGGLKGLRGSCMGRVNYLK